MDDLPEVGPSHDLLPALADLPGHLLWRAHARVSAALADGLPPGIDIHGYAVLLALAGGETRSQQALSETVSVSRTTMVKVAADLSRRGLVQRVRNPDDRRSYALTRTPEGAAAARAWRRHAEGVESALTTCLSPRERDDLRGILQRIMADELAPDTPDELRGSIGFLITRVHLRMHRDFLAALEPLRIEPRHYGALKALGATGPVSQSVVARALGVSGASMVQIADDLEARGLVARRRVAHDRRAQLLDVLPEADAVMARARELADEAHARRLGDLSAAEVDRLVTVLQRFITAP